MFLSDLLNVVVQIANRIGLKKKKKKKTLSQSSSRYISEEPLFTYTHKAMR
jgi:hypothetical protein